MPDLNFSPGIYNMLPHLSSYGFPDLREKLVLDLGCASGFFTQYFIDQGAEVVAWDINISVIEEVQKMTGMKAHIFERDVFDLNFNKMFDVVFCGSLLMHVFCPMYLLRLIHHALKPGGLLMLATAGMLGEESLIQCEGHQWRNKSKAEKEISSSNQSLWWFTKSALYNTLSTMGFTNVEIKGEFVLESTNYGKSINHDFKTLHFVFHANKPNKEY